MVPLDTSPEFKKFCAVVGFKNSNHSTLRRLTLNTKSSEDDVAALTFTDAVPNFMPSSVKLRAANGPSCAENIATDFCRKRSRKVKQNNNVLTKIMMSGA